MSQRVNPQSPDAEGGHQLQQLLHQALSLIDSSDLPLEIGARLQEVIDLIEGQFGLDRASNAK